MPAETKTTIEDVAKLLAIRDGRSCGMAEAEAEEWAENCWEDFLQFAVIGRSAESHG